MVLFNGRGEKATKNQVKPKRRLGRFFASMLRIDAMCYNGETMDKQIKNQPIVAGDIIKVAVWLLAMAVSFGYFTTEQSEQITAIIPAIAGLVAVLVNALIARVQWGNVTPWQPDNPLANYTPASEAHIDAMSQ